MAMSYGIIIFILNINVEVFYLDITRPAIFYISL